MSSLLQYDWGTRCGEERATNGECWGLKWCLLMVGCGLTAHTMGSSSFWDCRPVCTVTLLSQQQVCNGHCHGANTESTSEIGVAQSWVNFRTQMWQWYLGVSRIAVKNRVGVHLKYCIFWRASNRYFLPWAVPPAQKLPVLSIAIHGSHLGWTIWKASCSYDVLIKAKAKSQTQDLQYFLEVVNIYNGFVLLCREDEPPWTLAIVHFDEWLGCAVRWRTELLEGQCERRTGPSWRTIAPEPKTEVWGAAAHSATSCRTSAMSFGQIKVAAVGIIISDSCWPSDGCEPRLTPSDRFFLRD